MAVADAPDRGEGTELTEGQRALAQAVQSGKRVEVDGERSEYSTVFANPDGFSFTLEQSTVPVRAKQEGDWVDPDATLRTRADGTVEPRAAATQMSFSGGGDREPLARITDRGRSLELSWPGKLPVPELHGASAVYREVLPDVDLKVAATPESFQHLLIVKTPQAAKNAALKKLDFGLEARGLTVREGKASNLTAVDPDGKTVFRAPPARMWDSAGDAAVPGGSAQSARKSAKSAVRAEETPASADPAETSGAGGEPKQGDTVARMDVEVSKDSIAVLPDAKMLADTESSDFPLYIDPTVTWGESERTLLRSDGYESYGWGNGSDGQGEGAGKCGTWERYYCGPGYVQRLYYEFSPTNLKGKKVLDATFRVTEPWAFQCDPRWVDLVRTGNISSSTSWSSRPDQLDWMGDRKVSAGRGSLCDPDSPQAPIEFNDNADEPNENLTSTVRNFAAGKFGRLTLQIRAQDESDPSAWKRFKNDAVLSVQFVGIPDKPTGVGLLSGSGTVCEKSSADPAVMSDPTPLLHATAQTKKGGEEDAQLRVAFDIDQRNSDDTWSDTSADNGSERPSTGYVGDGKKVAMSWSKLTEGKLYRYRAWVQSYYNEGKSYLSGPSNATTTGWCYFKVDPTAPKAPTLTLGSPYTPCTPESCAAHGGPGKEASFTFGAATGDNNNVAYEYRLSSTGAWQSAKKVCRGVISNDVCASLPERSEFVIGWKGSFTPDSSGTRRLYARGKDNVGRWGAQNILDFLVAGGEGPTGRWHFDETDGAAKDSATAGGSARHDATLQGEAVRDDRGRRGVITHDAQGNRLEQPLTDRGLSLNGSSGYAATSGRVLETRSSYTVSAWARLDPEAAGTQTVLSQSGGDYSPFYVSYNADGLGDWSLRMLSKDASSGYKWNKARAKQRGAKGVWTHLAASYAADSNKVRLYVNGTLQSEADAGTPWSAEGVLHIGRGTWSGKAVDHFDGSIDEVQVWQRTLTDKEVGDDARLLTSENYAGAELVADWKAEQGSGTSVPDTTSGYGKELKLSGGASLDGETVVLDGTDDFAAATGPLVDDTGSFSVTTSVALDGDKLASKANGYAGQVLGQRSKDGSAWGFWYQVTGKKTVLDEETGTEKTVPVGMWHFGRLDTDGTFSSVVSDEEAELDGLVRLTGVFDAQEGKIRLFLSHNQNGDDQGFSARIGEGDFVIGRGFVSGGWKHYLPARLAEVRVWSGAMASPEQIETVVGD